MPSSFNLFINHYGINMLPSYCQEPDGLDESKSMDKS